MRGTFKLGLVIGVVSIVASGIPACGGDSESDNGKKTGGTGGKDGGTGATGGYAATGGTTGGGGGTTGGAGGGGGSGGASGGTGGTQSIKCASETCQGYSIAGFTIDACCAGASKDKCGVDITDQIASQIGIKPGCFELNQPGTADSDCPPLTGVPIIGTLPSCCNTAASKCSFMGDLSGFGGPNLGCVDPNNLPATDAGPPAACDGISSDSGTGGSPGDASADAASG